MDTNEGLDLVIVGGGIGGIICLKYARDAGLNVILLERGISIGGLWRDLPYWQDIQFRKEDWTLGSLPLAGEDQRNILGNIKAWVERFGLSPHIHLNATVTSARPNESGWQITTNTGTHQAKWLIAATGGHNRPTVPEVARVDSSITEYHSSALRDPEELRGKRVTVVGGGASAYDLLDLCFAHGAGSVAWLYRSTKWMRPTRRFKHLGIDMRVLARYQMLCLPAGLVHRLSNKDLRARYAKAGITEIMPESDFDIRRDQLIPGRPGMLDTNTSTPWAYAHVAKSIMSHIRGRPVFVKPPSEAFTNHFDLIKLLAPKDRENYTSGIWYLKYLWLALCHPWKRPMPIP